MSDAEMHQTNDKQSTLGPGFDVSSLIADSKAFFPGGVSVTM